jgi:ParD-like antitoxin of type II bacterial toxin-antitoxin system
MAVSVKLLDDMVTNAKAMSRALNRSVAGQIEYWAKIGKIAEENPDLSYDSIKQLLIAREEAKLKNLKPYEFDSL